MLTWGPMRQNWFSKPQSCSQWAITSHPSPRSEHNSRASKCLVTRGFRPAPSVLRTFLFPQIMQTYSRICQGHELTELIWVGLEKAGTCSYSASWPDPVQVAGTVWGTPPSQGANWWRDSPKVSGRGLVGDRSRVAAGTAKPPPSLSCVTASHRAPVLVHSISLPHFSVSLFFSGPTSSLGWLERLNDCGGHWSPAYVCPAFITNADLMNRS